MKTYSKIMTLFVGVGCIGAFTGCATAIPTYVNPSFHPSDVNRIVMLPTIDGRDSAKPEHNFEQFAADLQTVIMNGLKYKLKYWVVAVPDIGGVDNYRRDSLPSPGAQGLGPSSVAAEWIRNLGPANARWVIVPVLESIDGYDVKFHRVANVRLSFYLFNKGNQEVSFVVDASNFEDSAGLGGMILEALVDHYVERSAISLAAKKAGRALPKRPPPYTFADR